jgi:hypothetical protein
MDIRTESLSQLSGQIDHRRCHVGKIDWNENAFHVCAIELNWRVALSQGRDAGNAAVMQTILSA